MNILIIPLKAPELNREGKKEREREGGRKRVNKKLTVVL